MKKDVMKIGAAVIASAIVWGAVIIGCSMALKGTGCYDKIQNILVGGAMAHIILIFGSLAITSAKLKKELEKQGDPPVPEK